MKGESIDMTQAWDKEKKEKNPTLRRRTYDLPNTVVREVMGSIPVGSYYVDQFNKWKSVFHASVPLLNMNFVITLSK